MNQIENKQNQKLNKSKNFLKNSKFFKREIIRLVYFYLCPFGISKGTAKLFFFFKKFLSLKIYFLATLKDLYQIVTSGQFFIVNQNNLKKFKTVVVNWGYKTNFDNKGNYYDRHFNVSSAKCLNVKWIIIYLDKQIPQKIKRI